MANNSAQVNIGIGFSMDKTGLDQMTKMFRGLVDTAKLPGNEMDKGLQKASETAQSLLGILNKTFNSELGTLNITKFNQELSKSNLDLKTIQSNLSGAGVTGVNAYNRLTQAILGTNVQLKQSSKLLNNMATTMANTVKWGITSGIFNSMTGAIEKAYSYSKQLDTSLNDIRIVTGKSADEMDRFAENANQTAKSLGTSTLDYTNAALIYAQQGLDDAEVAARAETTLKAANVTGQTGAAVSEQLTAVWNGYKVSAAETEEYVDKLAAVAATTAADLEELSVGMSKVASAANAMGVDFDDLNAQIATIVSVTRQAPESVGTALKTIYARLGDLQVDGVDEFGVSLGEVSGKLQQMGIDVLDQQGNLRDMTSVIQEVAAKWNTWTEAQRQAAAVAMAGKRQYNNLIALFDNWDMYTDALNTSIDALGTLQKQQDVYMESTEAKLKTLKSTWQDLYSDLIDTDELNTSIELLTDFVQSFDNFIESFGGGIKSITGFGAIVASVFNKQISEGINSAIQRQQVFQRNMETVKAQSMQRAAGVASSEESAKDIKAQAIAANTKEQIRLSQEIYNIRAGITEEETNSVIQLQQEIGKLKEEEVYLTKSAEKIKERSKFGNENFFNNLAIPDSMDLLTIPLEQITEIIKSAKEEMKNLNKEESNTGGLSKRQEQLNNIKNSLKEIFSLEDEGFHVTEGLTSALKQVEVDNVKIVDLLKQENLDEESILKIVKQISKATNTLGVESQEYTDNLNKASIAGEKLKNKMMQFNEFKEGAASAANLTNNITNVTSAIGNLAMAWGSASSLFKTWSDDSIAFSDKMVQSLTTLGFTVPLVLSNFGKLGETLTAFNFSQEATNQLTKANTTVMAYNTAAQEAKIAVQEAEEAATLGAANADELYIKACTKETIATNMSKDAQAAENLQKEYSIITSKGNYKAKLKEVIAIYKGKTALDEETIAAVKNKVAMTGVAAGIGLVVAAIAIAVAAHQKYTEALIEENNATIEKNNSLIEEAKTHKEVYDSFTKLYEKYKDGQITKNELKDTTDQLCEAYKIEDGYLYKLSDDYETLAEKAAKAEKIEMAAALARARQSQGAAESTFFQKQKGGLFNGEFDSALVTSIRGNIKDNEAEEKIRNAILNNENLKDNIIFNNGNLGIGIDKNDPKEQVRVWRELEKTINEVTAEMSPAEKNSSALFKGITERVATLNESLTEVETQMNNVKELEASMAISDSFVDIDSYDKYFEASDKLRTELLKIYDNDEEEVNRILDEYAEGSNNSFIKIGRGFENLGQKLQLSEEELIRFINSLSDEDKELLFSGQINFDEVSTLEHVKQALENAKNSLTDEDLSIVVSLREKVSSEKKLTKKQLEEMAGEESSLASDYETELYDFDNQSQLDQIEILNQIADEKIEANNRYIENAKQAAQDDMALWEEEKAVLEKERDELETIRDIPGVDLTQEQSEHLQELKEDIEDLGEKIESVQEIAESGLSFDEIDDKVFENLTAGIDGVISKAEVLTNLAEKVGEGWKIAAKDIDVFASNFPQILRDQANYNVLQDGSIQLTQQGQAALQGVVAEEQNKLAAETASYQQQMQQQADLEFAMAEYYTQQAENLQSYLAGEQDAKTTEANMEKALADYQTKIQDTLGLNDQELNNQMQENLGMTAENAKQNTKSMYEFWCSVGDAAAKAAIAYEQKSFSPPGFKGGGITKGGGSTRKSINTNVGEASLDNFTNAQIQGMIQDFTEKAQKAQNRGAAALAKSLEAGAKAAAANNAMQGAANGTGGKTGSGSGKKGGGGSGKEITPKELKEWKDEFDRYYDYNNLIEKTEQSLKDLNREKEKAGRLELVKVLDQENKLLQKQIQNYELLANAQRAEASELQGILKGYGAEFNEAGELINYAQITADALDVYNSAVLQYNAGQISDDSLKSYETNLETFKKALDRYDTLIYKEMIENSEKIKDANDKILENNFQGWEIQIEVKLEKTQLERDLRDVRKILKKNFGAVYEDVTVTMQDTMDDFFSHLSDRATLEDAMADLRREIDIMVAGDSSDIFGTDLEKAKDEYKDLAGQYKETIEDAEGAYDDAWDKYITGIEQAKERFDKLNEDIDYHVEMLEFAKELSELLYTGDSPFADMDMYYKNMDTYYTNAKEANLTNLELAKTQRDMYEKLWRDSGATRENMDQWTEDQKLYYQYWQENQTELNNLTLEGAKLLKDEYLYEMQKTMDELENSLTNGLGFDEIKRQWDLIKKKSDEYFDDVEKIYEVESLANKFDAEISKTTGLKNQQRLKKVRDELIDQLREIDDLTEYDLQMAEARYDLELKQMALEDARNNKNSVKLVRNDQGNWSYQYVSDMDEIETKQQEMLDAWYKLYELPSEAYQKNLETRMQLDQEFYQQLDKINKDEKLSAEDKEKRKQELAEWYYSEVDRLADQNAKYQKDLSIATSGVLITAYNNDRDAYEGMTDEERALVDSLSQHKIDSYDEVRAAIEDDYDSIGTKTEETLRTSREDWRNSANDIIDLWQNNSTGIRAKVEEAFFNMGKARLNFQNDLKELQEKADIDFKNIAGYMNTVGDIISGTDNSLATKISKLRELGQAEIGLLNESVKSLRDHWGLVKTAIEDNLRLIDEYMQKQKQVNETPPPAPNIPSSPAVAQNVQTTAPSNNNSSNNTGGNTGGNLTGNGNNASVPTTTTPESTYTFKYWNKNQSKYITVSQVKKGTQWNRLISTAAESVIGDRNHPVTITNELTKKWKSSSNEDTIRGYTPFASGGYTGSWNDDSGKWAMLHQKELVLNKEDTANFLSGVKMIRDMSATNGSINKAIMQSVANMMGSLAGINTGIIGNKTNTNNESHQIFNITAEFPNANDVNEIREAILSLPNLANQFIMSRGEMD